MSEDTKQEVVNEVKEDNDFTFEALEECNTQIREVACGEFGLDVYPPQIEVITSEQMLDAYASSGLPITYPYWGYGKEFIINEQRYKKGMQALAYEIVINSDPCIAYLMEDNTMTMQKLVIAHAAYGHNSFFKGNYLFRQWTQADGIIDYLVFARKYVMECEEKYGQAAVEDVLDACHALSFYGVDRNKPPKVRSAREEKERQKERLEADRLNYDDLNERTAKWIQPEKKKKTEKESIYPSEPQENILYFVEKNSPVLKQWQRELVRIVRKLAQYFYPQMQTKVMNEGWATFWHYTILNRMYEKKLLSEGAMIEFLASHTNVVTQRGFDERGYGGINPYALGFEMFRDIRRICEGGTWKGSTFVPSNSEQLAEDRRWFPDMVGTDWLKTFDTAMRNYKDESFIGQYMSPKIMRDFKFFVVADHEGEGELVIEAIHNDEGYRTVRRRLASQYLRDNMIPFLQVVEWKRSSDRSLVVQHMLNRGRPLNDDSKEVMFCLAKLWGFKVYLKTVDENGEEKKTQIFEPPESEEV